jgi:cyclophilin family peptidyl-prolyl cis-trans isomerase
VAVIRATAVTGLGRAPLTEDDVALLSAAVADQDPRVRAAACAALAAQPAPAVTETAAAAIVEMWTPVEPQAAVTAIRAAGARSEIGSDGDLLDLARTEEPWLASEAFAAAVRRGAEGAGKLGREWLSGGELWRRRAVAAVAPLLGRDVEAAVLRDGDAAVRLAWLEPLDGLLVASRREVLERLVAEDPDPAVRTAALNHLAEAGFAGGFDELLDLAERWTPDDMPDARAAALTAALAATDDNDLRAAVIRRATEDADPAVGILVINAARSMGLPAMSHERGPRHNRKYYLDLVEWMQQRHWLDVVTDRGTIRIRLESLEAPITSREIFDLAEAGFYDGLTFHRVVPNFVVQGGDPRGDGWGGAGFVLPDEPAFRPFDSGRVGVATSGPNSGGGQLFITLAPADHLVGHYTNVGEVVHGRDILSRIRVGDRIRRVEVASGDEPPPPAPVLVGELDWARLETIDGWSEEYRAAQPDQQAVAQLREAAGSYEIVTVLGSWCRDSQREVPRLVRVLDELGVPVFGHRMIGVDRTRRIDDAELAVDAGVERTVERVATIVVFDGEGVELGRVVETAERPIEELLLEFVAPVEGW